MPWMALAATVAVLSVQTVPAAAQDDPWASPEIAAPTIESPPLTRDADSTGSKPVPQKRDSLSRPDLRRPLKRSPPTKAAFAIGESKSHTRDSWVRSLASLAGVVALIVLLTYGYRWVSGSRLSLAGKKRGSALIEVVGRTTLSSRQSLCLVRVGSRLVLVGSSHDSLTALDVIDDPDLTARVAGQAAQQQPGSHVTEFKRWLDDEAKGYDAADENRSQNPCGTGFQPVNPTGYKHVPQSRDGFDRLGATTFDREARTANTRHQLARTLRRLRTAVRGS